MRITRLDHLVLTVADIDATVAFHAPALAVAHATFDGRHQADRAFEPKAACPTRGSADLCFIADAPLDRVPAHLESCGIAIEQGPVARTGALSAMHSLYIRDPDRNLIEIAVYEPAVATKEDS